MSDASGRYRPTADGGDRQSSASSGPSGSVWRMHTFIWGEEMSIVAWRKNGYRPARSKGPGTE